VYNDGKHVSAAIDSALAQDYPYLEVLVSDNASTDDTGTILANHPGIAIATQPTLLEMAANWNTFRNRVRGEWVLFLCSDDILKPHALRRCVESATPNVDAVFFEFDYLREGKSEAKPPFYVDSAWIPATEQHGIFIIGNNFPLTMALIRRETLDAVGWFDESYNFCTDWQLWLKVTATRPNAQIAYVADSLAYYRLHGSNETGRCIRNRSALNEVIRMKEHFLARYTAAPERHREIVRASRRGIARLASRYAETMAAEGDEETAEYYRELSRQFIDDDAPAASPAGPPWPLPPNAVRFPLAG
jgi:glycosyltransferase involved in cell wall biosynthesis